MLDNIPTDKYEAWSDTDMVLLKYAENSLDSINKNHNEISRKIKAKNENENWTRI